MNIIALAIILLILRAIAAVFMIWVLSIQYPLLKAVNDPEIKPLRYVLFIFAAIIAVGNVVPIAIDIYGLFIESQVKTTFDPLLTVYFLNNAIVAAISAVCFWLVYQVSGLNTDEVSKRNGND